MAETESTDDTVPCAVCHQPVRLEEAHSLHTEDCPSRTEPNWTCTCDIWVHPECCPECKEEQS